jgi:hypothetical protein
MRAPISRFLVLAFLSLAPIGAWAGDTEGKVARVVTPPTVAGKHVVRIYFSSFTSDRWGCLQNPGYVEAHDAGPYVDAKALDRLVALALAAMATDMTLSIDSPGANPCTEANRPEPRRARSGHGVCRSD